VATADLTILALGRSETSASSYIAQLQAKLKEQDRVSYQMHAMGTELEGKASEILQVVEELHSLTFELGAPRVYTVLKLDDRRDKPNQTLEDKVDSVRQKLQP
jgi:uncharacterized protein (TIGR00106 family)